MNDTHLISVGGLSKDTADLCDAAYNGQVDKVKAIVKRISVEDINGKNNRGQTALYCAARQGHLLVIQELVKVKGINLDAQEPKGSTALHAASYGCHGKVVAFLLSCGATPDVKKFPVGNTRGLMAR